MLFDLEAGKKHSISILPNVDGKPDPTAKIVAWQSSTAQVTEELSLDLTDMAPGADLDVDIAATIAYDDGTQQTVQLNGTVHVTEPAPKPVEDPAPVDPTAAAAAPSPVAAAGSTAKPVPPPALHVYGADLKIA